MFEPRIIEITELCHAKGAQGLHGRGQSQRDPRHHGPGDLGFDVCHSTCTKTFTTPHGGAPRGGPVGVKAH